MSAADATALRDEEELSYHDGCEHLADELDRLDRLLALRAADLRSKAAAEEIASRPLYVSHDEVDRLLGGSGEAARDDPQATALLADAGERIARRVNASLERGVDLPLPRLAALFGLSPPEVEALVICLAPELDRKYDRIYAYLQDDISRRKPSVDLALRLLVSGRFERWRARAIFADHAPLLRAGLLETSGDPQSPSGASDLAKFLRLDSRILSFLLDNPALPGALVGRVELHHQLPPLERVPVDGETANELLSLARHVLAGESPEGEGQPPGRREPGRLVLHLHGPRGVGKRELAMGICAELGCPLLILDAELLPAEEADAADLLRLTFREGLLQQAALLLDRADGLLAGEAAAGQKGLARAAAEYGWLTFVATEKAERLGELFPTAAFHAAGLELPATSLRLEVWQRTLAALDLRTDDDFPPRLAERFRLTPGQIRDACRAVDNRCRMSSPRREPRRADFYAACRGQSDHRLSRLAVKIEARYGWDDLVLPAATRAHLEEVSHQVRHRHRVLGDWGFGRKLSHGKGLSALFSGPPGTGKTMAAEVLAGALGLDLYKIDLSGVVSKYIGETEKNLARIFDEAETANAILFFDEADALFGKRTEVQDAHDRYANIETSYLLQKMEEYEGVAILATNLQQNMDDAFLRRIRFIVEFPFPGRELRREIWRHHFPPEAPVRHDIDYQVLAERFQIAGGNIRNIVLNAAFLAAEDGGVIGMEHVLRGTRREYEKIGKLWNENLYEKPLPGKDGVPCEE